MFSIMNLRFGNDPCNRVGGGVVVSAILCKRRSSGYGPVVGASSFLFVTLCPDSWIIRQARTAVKAERSEFIVSLDGGRSRPY
jgi:hypothetical protein